MDSPSNISIRAFTTTADYDAKFTTWLHKEHRNKYAGRVGPWGMGRQLVYISASGESTILYDANIVDISSMGQSVRRNCGDDAHGAE